MAMASVDSGLNRQRYTGRRALFDALALVDIIGIAAAEASVWGGGRAGYVYYAIGTAALYATFWLILRRREYPAWAVLLLQTVVMTHMAGRFIRIDGVQLYQVEAFWGIAVDKVVHAYNTAVGAAFALALFRQSGITLRGWEPLIVIMVACGLASLIEIVEYSSTLVLVRHNVGDYANNAQDLIANLLGAGLGWAVARMALGREERFAMPDRGQAS